MARVSLVAPPSASATRVFSSGHCTLPRAYRILSKMREGQGDDLVRGAAALAAIGIEADPALVAHIVALDALGSPHLADLALAFACAKRQPGALAEFERRFGGEFAGALSRLSMGRAEIDEVAQTVRERLFVER